MIIRHHCCAPLAVLFIALPAVITQPPPLPAASAWPLGSLPILRPPSRSGSHAQCQAEDRDGNGIGRSLEREGKLNEALKVYEEVAKKDSRRIDTQQRMAISTINLATSRNPTRSTPPRSKREPKNVDLLCDRGYSFYLQDRNAESESTLRGALAIDPHMARAHNNLGLVLARSGKSDEALMEFSRAGCRQSDARVNLAYCLMAQKDFANAQKQFQLAMAADPQSNTAFRGLAQLRSVASQPQPSANQIAPTSAQQVALPAATTPQAPPWANMPSAPATQSYGQPLTPQERVAIAPAPDRKSALSIMLSPSNP